MILVTGGAGFIGSNLHAALSRRGQPSIIADRLGTEGKWRNLALHPPARIVRPEALDDFLATAPALDAIVHLGAISATTTTDGDLVWETNVELSWRIWQWCARHGVRFIYASSASTYGDGANGFDDDPALLPQLRPLNLYGWSKHAFDLRVAAALADRQPAPPQWVGLKFFNVYGPNEYHKGPMISVVKRKYDEVAAGQPARLFRSDRPDIPDGAQQARLHLDRRRHRRPALAAGPPGGQRPLQRRNRHRPLLSRPRPRRLPPPPASRQPVEFVPMPDALRGHYQSFTEAQMSRLRASRLPRSVHAAGRRRAPIRPKPPRRPGALRMNDLLSSCPGLTYPGFDPVLVHLGPLAIRWYALAYIGSLVLGWRIVRRLVRLAPAVATERQTDDFLTWATLGVVLGGRIGYVLFYQPLHYLQHPLDAFAVWEGGMSFHGGALGVTVALILFTRREKIPLLGFADRIAVVVPHRPRPRPHRQLHQRRALGPRGPALGAARRCASPPPAPSSATPASSTRPASKASSCSSSCALFCRSQTIRARFGTLTGIFLVGYGCARIIGEFFRQPDAFLGFLWGGITMGQLLSVPMVLAGVWLIWRAQPRAVARLNGRA